MIHIIYDALKLTSQTSRNTIGDIGEYPGAYTSILLALQSNNDLHCTVYISPVLQWLKNLSLRYPQNTFVFETLDARQALAQCQGMEISVSVTNKDFFKPRLFASPEMVETSLRERNLNGLFPVCG